MYKPPQLTIGRDQLAVIRADAEGSYPEECCGFLYGTSTNDEAAVTDVRAIANEQSGNRGRRFLISPEQFLAAERHAQDAGVELLGFYHSHPDQPALPSEYDRDHALPLYSYVIVSVRDGRARETRSWKLLDDRTGYIEEAVLIIHEATL